MTAARGLESAAISLHLACLWNPSRIGQDAIGAKAAANSVGYFDETPENVKQACRVGEWMDKRDPLLQCSYRILVGRRASEIGLLGSAWRG